MRGIVFLIALSTSVAAVGCSGFLYQAYPGPPRPKEQVAILRLLEASYSNTPANLRDNLGRPEITAVDGKRADIGFATAVELLPGRHTITFYPKASWHKYVQTKSLEKDIFVQPGLTYVARLKAQGNSTNFQWGIDIYFEPGHYPQLQQDVHPSIPTAAIVDLAGTVWNVTTEQFDHEKFFFMKDGVFQRQHENEGTSTGSWMQRGESIEMDEPEFITFQGTNRIDAKSRIRFQGTIRGNRIEGKARTDYNYEWLWAAEKN